MTDSLLLGVDGGGTSTRALVATGRGEVLGYAEAGGSSPEHNDEAAARENFRAAVSRSLRDADRDLADVDALTAGLAGLDDEADRRWADAFVDMAGLECPTEVVNDAVVAHAGALGTAPGIVVIGGTGSIVLGVDRHGESVRNYDFDQYADAAARHLGRTFVHHILAGRWDETDAPLVEAALDEWDLPDVATLRRACIEGDHMDTDRSGNALDRIAPTITAAAADGSPLARTVCAAGAAEVALAVELVADAIDLETTPVALLGSVARSAGMRDALDAELDAAAGDYDVVEPALSPVAGAVLLSHQRVDGGGDTALLTDSLSDHEVCRID